MITLQELNSKNYATSKEQMENLNRLLKAVNHVRKLWNKPMIITSGLRSLEDQQRINPGSPKSKHLIGAAVDIKDDGSLYKWLHDNPKVMEDAGLYGETGTIGWVHLQCIPPKSGNRWFLP